MDKKQIKILIITFIAVLLIVFVVFLLVNIGDKVNNSQSEINSVDNTLKEEKKDSELIKEVIAEKSAEELSEMKIKSVAKNFTERYGTWSSDNQANNFKSTKVYTTSRMENIIKDFVENDERLANDYPDYYGITTKALNVKIIDSNESSANLLVSVQQTETLGDVSGEDTSYSSLSLELIEYNGDWFVNYA